MIAETEAVDRCYVVDDDDLVRGTLEAIAQESGFHVQAFSSGSTFLDALPRLAPGIVILDVRMPEPDGVKVLKRLNLT